MINKQKINNFPTITNLNGRFLPFINNLSDLSLSNLIFDLRQK